VSGTAKAKVPAGPERRTRAAVRRSRDGDQRRSLALGRGVARNERAGAQLELHAGVGNVVTAQSLQLVPRISDS
jgi:hypothetical protein